MKPEKTIILVERKGTGNRLQVLYSGGEEKKSIYVRAQWHYPKKENQCFLCFYVVREILAVFWQYLQIIFLCDNEITACS